MSTDLPRSPFDRNWLVHKINKRHIEAAVYRHVSGRLLDVGCGQRPYRDILQRHADSCTRLEFDRGRYGSAPPDVWGSGVALPFRNGSFDSVVSFQVLEHVPEPAQMVREISRVLKPGGYLVLSAPHMWGVHEEPEDYFRFTGFGLAHLSRQAGLEVVRVTPMAGYWVTAGARFCHYLQQFEKIGLSLFVRPLYAIVQIGAMALDRLHRVESDTWNFMLVAEKGSC